jgi:hypothetical protein
MTSWEYMLIALPQLEPPTASRATSAPIRMLNDEGADGWEAVGMLTLPSSDSLIVLLKRPRPA